MAKLGHSETLAILVAEQMAEGMDFPTLCASCAGASPLAIRTALQTLASALGTTKGAAQLLRQATAPNGQLPELDARLPVPHPLDFDWRFSSASADSLAASLIAEAGQNGTVLLVGVPSVLLAICDRHDRPHVWFASRPSDPVTLALRREVPSDVRFVDISGDLSGIGAQVSLVDPPWYDDIADGMIRAASSGTTPSGSIWVAGPDRLTGLSAAPKLTHIDAVPGAFGLETAEFVSILRYDMPPFERLAFERNGVRNVPPTWRTGRLFRCRRRADQSKHTVHTANGWLEVGEPLARVWLRPANGEQHSGMKISAGLSRLDPERVAAAVWTSGHRYSLGHLDLGKATDVDRLAEIVAYEAAAVRELVVWRGRVRSAKA